MPIAQVLLLGMVPFAAKSMLADALKVRRASVTDCLHVLEGERIVRCTRGETIVRDRAALEELAGDAYGAAERTYATLIGPFGKGGVRS